MKKKKINVLLVSNDEVFNSIVQDEEVHPGIKFEIINSFKIVLEFIRLIKVDAVILSNLGLFPRDIPKSIRNIKYEFPDLPVIILSGYDETEFVSKSADCGAETFFKMPVDLDDLVKRIKVLVN